MSHVKTVPRDHQRMGQRFLVKNRTSIIGFKTGLGKSLTLLMAIDYAHGRMKRRPVTFLFAPKNATTRVWPKEIAKHTTFSCATLNEYRFGGAEPDIVLVRYSEILDTAKSKVKGNVEFLEKALQGQIACFDEIHRLKSPQAKMVKALFSCTRKALCLWGLTATSVLNTPLDLYGILSFLDPRIFGTKFEFQRQYCVMKDQYVQGGRKVQVIADYKNMEHLREVRKQYILSMSQDISVEFHRVEYVLTQEEDDRYLLAADGIIGETYKEFAGRLPDLQRVVDGSLDSDGKATYRGSKYKAFLPYIQRSIGGGNSVIIFTEYYHTHDMLSTLLREDFPNIPIYRISGKHSDEFEETPCIVLSTAGGSESLNMQFANHVFFYSIPFSVGQFVQTLGRITRMDSDHLNDLHTYLPFNPETIDYYKYILLERHTATINYLLGTDANLPKEVREVRIELVEDMRKKLLWRKKGGKKRM